MLKGREAVGTRISDSRVVSKRDGSAYISADRRGAEGRLFFSIYLSVASVGFDSYTALNVPVRHQAVVRA